MMTFDSSLKPEELGAAQIVARRVELNRVDMISGSFSLKVQPEELPAGLSVDRVHISHKYSFSTEKNTLSVFVHYICHGKRSDSPEAEQQQASVFELDATFMLQYRLVVIAPPEDKRDDFFMGFAKVNGVFNSWPYLREFVQSSVSRAGVAGVTLPVFRVPQLPQPQAQLQPSVAAPVLPPVTPQEKEPTTHKKRGRAAS